MRTHGTVKSATAFRTISEVSTELDVPQHVLRFWESRFPQLRPLKRGGGRRYYRPEDVELLRRIQSLLYREGYTIKGVQRLLTEARGAALEEGGGQADGAGTGEEPAGEESVNEGSPNERPWDEDGEGGIRRAMTPGAVGSASAAQPESADDTATVTPAAGLPAPLRQEIAHVLDELKIIRSMLSGEAENR